MDKGVGSNTGNMEINLDNYTILNMIGKGGMATVYRAVQKSLDRTVALKELDLSQSHSVPAAAERFRLEARAAASLEHTAIINIYDFWEQDQKAYIAMELIDGFELKEGLAVSGPLDPPLAVHIASEVAEALKYAHAKGMIHRDVKPANIMLTTLGNVKLADFGIVSVTGSAELTMADQILGTPAYMSPEQVAGRETGSQSDIFSLGIVMYEMVTGRRPFSGSNPVALIHSIVKDDPDPPGSLAGSLPAGLSGAIMKCLEKDPDMRYSSMGQLVTDLERCRPGDGKVGAELVAELVKAVRENSGAQVDVDVPPTRISAPKTVVSEVPGMKTAGNDGTSDLEFQVEETVSGDLPPLMGLSGKGLPDQEKEHLPVVHESKAVHLEFADKDAGPGVQAGDGENESGQAPGGRRRRSRLPLLLGVVVALAALAILVPSRKDRGRESVSELPPPAVEKARIPEKEPLAPGNTPAPETRAVGLAYLKVVVRPAGKVFIDGKALGDSRSGESFRVPTGLHTIVVRNRKFGSRSFLIDLSDGERKRIVVDFLSKIRPAGGGR